MVPIGSSAKNVWAWGGECNFESWDKLEHRGMDCFEPSGCLSAKSSFKGKDID